MRGWRLEDRLGQVLRIGSTLSTVLLAAGLALLLFTTARAPASSLMNAGLVILLATPVTRVMAATIGFAVRKEWRFVAMTIAVLTVLVASAVTALR